MSITNEISIINCDSKFNYSFVLKEDIILQEDCPHIIKVVNSVSIPKIYKIDLVISPSTDGINNFKGERLGGYKIKISGVINLKISYISSEKSSIRSINKEIPFIELVPITLEDKISNYKNIKVNVIKDVLYKVNDREILACILLNLDVNN